MVFPWQRVTSIGGVSRQAGVDVLCLITSCNRYSCQISPVYYSAIKHLNINELYTSRKSLGEQREDVASRHYMQSRMNIEMIQYWSRLRNSSDWYQSILIEKEIFVIILEWCLDYVRVRYSKAASLCQLCLSARPPTDPFVLSYWEVLLILVQFSVVILMELWWNALSASLPPS